MTQFFKWAAILDGPDTLPQPPAPTHYIDFNDSWQTELNNAGAGAVIGMNAGTYSGFNVTPLADQIFVAVGSVTLDGNGASECFNGHNVRGIEIWGQDQLLITDYNPSKFHGAICCLSSSPDWYSAPPYRDNGWLVDHVEVGNVQGWAAIILDGHDNTIRYCDLHDIGDVGFKIIHGDDGHVHNNEIYNITPSNWGDEGGACKCWGTRRLVLENNYVHDITNGPGLWCDSDNIDTIYRNNTILNVSESQIFHEISGPCIVEDNTLTGVSATPSSLGVWERTDAGIHIVNSGSDQYGGTWDGAIVRNNDVTNFYVGIAFIDQTRSDQWGNNRTNTTEGAAYGNTIDNCDNNGDQMDHSPSPYVPGALPVDWTSNGGNTLLNGSTIN